MEYMALKDILMFLHFCAERAIKGCQWCIVKLQLTVDFRWI